MIARLNREEGARDAESEGGAETKKPDLREERLRRIRSFHLKPREVRDYLDRFVIGQEEAKKVLSVAICDHYNHVRACLEHPERAEADYAKHNVILLGPTGVGKTYLVRCLARLIGVPFVKADATKFSETGYVGHDTEDLVRDLVKAADGDEELAQYGIIFVDEIDKIASTATAGGRDVSGRGVQINLLKLMEETDVSLFSQTDLLGQMQAVLRMQRGEGIGAQTLNTRHILFIVSGAFEGLADCVRRRLSRSRIGFTQDDTQAVSTEDLLGRAGTRDFIEYGFEPEFIGRLPVRVVCRSLSEDDLTEILRRSEGSILEQYRRDFEGYGITLRVEDEALRAIARKAYSEKTGARGLMTVLERLFRDFKFEMPSLPIRELTLTAEMVADPGRGIREVLERTRTVRRERLAEDLKRYVEHFEKQQGIRLRFSAAATEMLLDICLEQNLSVAQFCLERLHDLEYAVQLIMRNTGKRTFTITKKILERPSEELSKRVTESFAARAGGSGGE